MWQLNRIVLPALTAWLSYRYYYHTGYKNIWEYIKTDTEWLWARVPNLGENLSTAFPLALFGVVFEPWMERLYQTNPTAKSVVRDAMRIPSNTYAWYSGEEVGHTNITYDVGNIMAGSLTTLCKVSIIGSYAISYPDANWEGASRAANYICDPITRAFSLISRAKQEGNNTANLSYLEFAQQNLSLTLMLQSIAEGVTKAFVADQCGKMFAQLGVFALLKNSFIKIENQYINWAFNAQHGMLLYDRVISVQHSVNTYIQPLKLFATLSVIGIDFAFKTFAEMFISYIMIPLVRASHDAVGKYMENYIQGKLYAKDSDHITADSTVDQLIDHSIEVQEDNILHTEDNSPNDNFLEI
jgi:hypothetical protein